MFAHEYLTLMLYTLTSDDSIGDSPELYITKGDIAAVDNAMQELVTKIKENTIDGICYYFRVYNEDTNEIEYPGSGYLIDTRLVNTAITVTYGIVDSIRYLQENDCVSYDKIHLFEKLSRSGIDNIVYKYLSMTDDQAHFEAFENSLNKGKGYEGRVKFVPRLRRLAKLMGYGAPNVILEKELRMVADCLLCMYCPTVKYYDSNSQLYIDIVNPNEYDKHVKSAIAKYGIDV